MERRSSDVEHLRHLYFGGGLQSVDAVRGLTDAVADGAEATAPWRWLEQHLDKDFNLLQQIYSQRFRMQMLLQRQDRVGMADSIEIRVPFLRPKLVDWSNRLRLDDKVDFASGQTKLCLRAAMENRLPKRILTKGKDGFPSDMTSWLKTSVMYEVATKLVGDSGGFCQNYLDGKAANALVDDHFAGRRPLATLVWNLVSLEIWHRICRPSVAKQSVLEI
jgi:asparagine synthase (glutamine-hydrolysing)